MAMAVLVSTIYPPTGLVRLLIVDEAGLGAMNDAVIVVPLLDHRPYPARIRRVSRILTWSLDMIFVVALIAISLVTNFSDWQHRDNTGEHLSSPWTNTMFTCIWLSIAHA